MDDILHSNDFIIIGFWTFFFLYIKKNFVRLFTIPFTVKENDNKCVSELQISLLELYVYAGISHVDFIVALTYFWLSIYLNIDSYISFKELVYLSLQLLKFYVCNWRQIYSKSHFIEAGLLVNATKCYALNRTRNSTDQTRDFSWNFLLTELE